jgi:hypothetical protein
MSGNRVYLGWELSVGHPLSIGIPCRADEPSLHITLDSLLAACRHPGLLPHLYIEIVICINGLKSKEECHPLMAVRQMCAQHAIPLREYEVMDGWSQQDRVPLSFTVLCSERRGKAIAWNAIRRWAASEAILFCDADVWVGEEAISCLYSSLQADSRLRLVASKQIPLLPRDNGWLCRAAALPYRFYFHNVSGRLYIMRRDALVGDMPEGLLFEDAWLTVAVGKQWIAQNPRAQVFFLPPATLGDCLAERVRTEAGKIQIKRSHPELLAQGPLAAYPWREFIRGIHPRELPLVLLLLGIRLVARTRVKWTLRAGLRAGEEQSLWQTVVSSKQWEKRTSRPQ